MSAAGAFVGALGAFLLEALRRWREVRDNRIQAGYRALLAIGEMRAHAASLYDGLVKPWRDNPAGWYEVKQLTPFPVFDHRVEIPLLAFLMRKGRPEDIQAVQNALLAEKRFNAWVALVEARNQQKLEAMEILSRQSNPRKMWSEEELEAIFGRRRKLFLQSSTAALPKMYDELSVKLDDAIDRLHEALTRNIWNHDFQVPHLAPDPGSRSEQAHDDRV